MSVAAPSDLTVQRGLAEAWCQVTDPSRQGIIHVADSIAAAVKLLDQELSSSSSEADFKVLVTGSLHLVGGVLEVAGLPLQ